MIPQDNHKQHIDLQNKDIKSLKIFSTDTQAAYLFKKTEQLASALYLITGLLSDNEPMKWSMRDIGLRLLSHGLSLSRMSLKERHEQGYDLLVTVLESLSLLEIAHTAELLSRMNYSLIKAEIERVIHVVESEDVVSVSPRIALPSDFFSKEEFPSPSAQTSLKSPFGGGGFHKGQKDIKDNMSYTKNENVSEKGGSIQKDKNKRQEKIIELLKGGKVFTIKEFAKTITDCSEKTIQRELLSLVSLGVLKKEGERRWSKYSLKS